MARTWSSYEDSYRLEVGGVKFALLWDQTDVFRDGQLYRVHHLVSGASLPMILSVETVPSSGGPPS